VSVTGLSVISDGCQFSRSANKLFIVASIVTNLQPFQHKI